MISFICNSLLLGVGLAMDAFSVSIANALNEPRMRRFKRIAIAGAFAFFQFLMPVIGWACVHTIMHWFEAFSLVVPWIALILLCYIGGKMILDCVRGEDEKAKAVRLTSWQLLVQSIATSIDALSVGFAIAGYGWQKAIVCAVIIACVTFVICLIGLQIGKRLGTKLTGKAGILGGAILIFIGLKIFITDIFL